MVMTKIFCKNIISESEEGTESCSPLGFVENKLFRNKATGHKALSPLPDIG